MTIRDYPIAILGAGPVGMAAAAHLTMRGIPFRIFEAGHTVGANLIDWGHVRVFSPWRYNIDKAAERLLAEIGWVKPYEEELPTGNELVNNYLLPLSFHPKIEPHLHLSARVNSITRRGINKMRTADRENVPFLIQVVELGVSKTYETSGVIDATGTWKNPNPIGAGGVFAIGELENSHRVAYRIPDILGKDKLHYADKKVMVVGSGHSAINSLLDLATLKTHYPDTELHWVLQSGSLSGIYGGKEEDALPARGALGIRIEKLVQEGTLKIHTPYYIHEILERNGALTIKGYLQHAHKEIEEIDEIIANTGARPDLSILKEVRVQTDPALESVPELAELIDPNIHSCGTVRPHGEAELRQPEPNFYVVGAKSYGRAPTFLMATGYEQVRSIAAWLDGDKEAARRVELDLPQTGVCSSDGDTGAACCGTTPSTQQKETTQSYPTFQNDLNIETMEKLEKAVLEPAASGCCGGAPSTNEAACCKLDEEKKAEGLSGCGCGSAPASESKSVKASACCS